MCPPRKRVVAHSFLGRSEGTSHEWSPVNVEAKRSQATRTNTLEERVSGYSDDRALELTRALHSNPVDNICGLPRNHVRPTGLGNSSPYFGFSSSFHSMRTCHRRTRVSKIPDDGRPSREGKSRQSEERGRFMNCVGLVLYNSPHRMTLLA